MRYPAEGVVMKGMLVALLALGCAEEETVPCADGYERDAAGSCQVADPGASSDNGGGAAGADNFEGDGAGECSDGVDNDGDGLTDCEDDTCEGSPDCADPDDNGDAEPCDGIATGWNIGDCAENFTIVDQNGDERSLYEFYGDVIMIDLSGFT